MGDMQAEIIELINARLLEGTIENHLAAEYEKQQTNQQISPEREQDIRTDGEQHSASVEQHNMGHYAETH